jgi:hypothetical protein
MVISAEALTHAATRVAILLPPGPNIGRLVAANGSRGEGGPFAAIRSQIDAQSHQGDALILRTRSERNGVCYVLKCHKAGRDLRAYRKEKKSRNKSH